MKKPIHEQLKCYETGVEFYKCSVTKINAVTPSKEKKETILIANRFIGLTKKSFQNSQITENGRIYNQELFMVLYPEDINLIKVGHRVRYNSTKMRSQIAFNKDLKPFIYDINKKDIVDLEIREIKMYGDICKVPYMEAFFIAY